MSSESTADSDELPQPRYEEDLVQRLNQLENRIAKAKIALKETREKLGKKTELLKHLKDEIAAAQRDFWKIDAYVTKLERALEPLVQAEAAQLSIRKLSIYSAVE